MRILGNRFAVLSSLACAVLLAACAQTSKVADGIDTGSLAKGNRAVALMKVGSAEAICHSARVTLARPEGKAYRELQVLTVTAPKKLDEPTVAEVELDPGQYHVVAFDCTTQRGPLTIAGRREGSLYATSLASFTVASGEIVNVGYLRLMPVRRHIPLTSSYNITISVSDWPLAELERYKVDRPQLYAAMKTRLMTVSTDTAVTADKCESLRQLQAAGKVQNMPSDCAPTPARDAAKPASGKRRSGA